MNGGFGCTVYYPSTIVVDMRGIGREWTADSGHVCTFSLKTISVVTIRKYILGYMNHSSEAIESPRVLKTFLRNRNPYQFRTGFPEVGVREL